MRPSLADGYSQLNPEPTSQFSELGRRDRSKHFVDSPLAVRNLLVPIAERGGEREKPLCRTYVRPHVEIRFNPRESGR